MRRHSKKAIHLPVTRFAPLVVLVSVLSLSACTLDFQFSDPRAYPYLLVPERSFIHSMLQAFDLDHDGRDELTYYYAPGGQASPPRLYALTLKTLDDQVIEQTNFDGIVRPPHLLDLEDDGLSELFVPFIRNDSLFLSILDARGQKRYTFFLINGQPRIEPDGVLAWEPSVENFYLLDLNKDGRKELVTVVSTGYARLPRGLLVHSLPDGHLLGQKLIGTIGRTFLADFDDDGDPEIVTATWATNNGAEMGGFDDQHAYLIVFELVPTPEVSWYRELGERWANASLAYTDVDADQNPEFLVLTTTSSSNPSEATFELFDPGTGRIRLQRHLAEPLRFSSVINLDRDAYPEILTIRGEDEIWVFDQAFEIKQRRRFPYPLRALEIRPDMDGDGIPEMVLFNPNQILLLQPDLSIKAVHPMGRPTTFLYRKSGGQFTDIIRRGLGLSPLLLVGHRDGPVALEVVRNPLYLVYRWGPWALWGLGLTGAMSILWGLYRLQGQNRLLKRVRSLALDDDKKGFLLLDSRNRILWLNATLRHQLGLTSTDRIIGQAYGAILKSTPALGSFLNTATEAVPARHHEGQIPLQMNGSERTARVHVEPFFVRRLGRPYWLLSMHASESETASEDIRTWAMMARKVTHDIKNPLTSILLTAQRLQTEYRKHAPETAISLDPYAEQIIERVTALRRMTKQFMKILDVESLELVKTDMRALVMDMQDLLRSHLPPGLDLVLKLQPDLPPVLLDREQIQTVLENLVANAIQAIPDGGTITISAYPVLNLPASHIHLEPCDYLVLEVQDNGLGIPETVRTRLFEPGFTTKEFGTGLGLALVRKAVDQHGGFIEVESEVGVGSVFSIYLPLAPS